VNIEADKLRDEVFKCERCTQVRAFRRPPGGGPYFKFPPIIGARSQADILFIGINPRRTDSNRTLHDWVMESEENFGKLAGNETQDGRPYIAARGEEEHYHCHMIVIEGVFGPGTKFEAVAAVTELMHCASPNEPTILGWQPSPCAALYLERVMMIVQPRAVVAVGSGVKRHLEQHFHGLICVPLVKMEHPRQLTGQSREIKEQAMRPTIDQLRAVL
jgi:hypothetical protein